MKKKRRVGRVICMLLTIGSLSTAAVVLWGHTWIVRNFQTRLPENFFSLAIIGEPSHFYTYEFSDRQNRLGEAQELSVGGFSEHQSAYVEIQRLPKHVTDAFVAIEDKRFWEHRGVDWYRTLAAGANHLLGMTDRFGASTITQQLVKNMTGENDISIKRKIQEILYALDLERTLDKSEILELYLNMIHFSDGCNGIGEAAEHYFGKQADQLTVTEAASLAAIINNPSYYNPIRHPEHNQARRNLILSEMHEITVLS